MSLPKYIQLRRMVLKRFVFETGIGFKSVFKVTTRPEIHSRQFHFRFDSADQGLGYIVPLALSPPDDWDSTRGTNINLPLNYAPADAGNVLRNFQKRLDQIKPHLLLFLRKLRNIKIADETYEEGYSRRERNIVRSDIRTGCIWPEIKATESSAEFVLVDIKAVENR